MNYAGGYRRNRGALFALVVLSLGSLAFAGDHTPSSGSPSGRQQVDGDKGFSDKLMGFLTSTFGLQRSFVERSYGKRVAFALRQAQLGDISGIQQVAETLRSRLGGEPEQSRMGTVLQQQKGGPESDEQVDALIDWLELPRETAAKGKPSGPSRPLVTADGPRSVQDFLDDIRKQPLLRDRYSCVEYCRKTASAIDRNICDNSCGYAFPSRDSLTTR